MKMHSIRFKHEFDSIVSDESDSQDEKQSESRISTFRGIMIDSSDDDENAYFSIRFKHEFDSNVSDESDSQDEKHSQPRISTFRGINIESSDDLENTFDPIRCKRILYSNAIEERTSSYQSKMIQKSHNFQESKFENQSNRFLNKKIRLLQFHHTQ
jgi:hypothetical protein